MINKVAKRMVGKDNSFFFKGKRYRIESPELIRQIVFIHYDSESGNVHTIDVEGTVGNDVHFIREPDYWRSDNE